MQQVIDFIIANWPYIVTGLLILVGLAVQVAKGRGRQLAELALDFVLEQAKAGLDDVDRSDIRLVVHGLYEAAPSRIAGIPWKAFVSEEQCEAWAWEAFQRLHGYLDSAGGVVLKTRLRTAKRARTAKIV